MSNSLAGRGEKIEKGFSVITGVVTELPSDTREISEPIGVPSLL